MTGLPTLLLILNVLDMISNYLLESKSLKNEDAEKIMEKLTNIQSLLMQKRGKK